MITHGTNIKLFTGNANPELAGEISEELNRPLGKALVTKFSDGETRIELQETVRGYDVFLIQPLCNPVNDSLMELLIMIDASKRSSAGRITAVIPYYGYARQDRVARARDPIAAKLVADLLTAAGADRILTMDLHAPQIQGFFDIPVDHMIGVPVIAAHYLARQFSGEDLVVISPDLGSVTRARNFANRLNAPLAIIDKRRPKANMAEVVNIIGDIKGKRALLCDDLLDTGGTFIRGAEALLGRGAREVYACCTHGVLSGDCAARIRESEIKEVVITNTIPISEETVKESGNKIRTLTVAPIFAKAIERIYEDLPMSILFD